MDWKEFVETLSLVEKTLRSDPADVYSGMDFSTRDRYRHSVEVLRPAQPTLRGGRCATRYPTGRGQYPAKGTGRPDRPCGILSDRQRPAHAGTHGKCAVALANDHRTEHPPFPADVLCGRYRGAHVTCHVRVCAAGADARSAGVETHSIHSCVPRLCQSTGRGADELAVHAAGKTSPAPAPGLFLRHRFRLPHDGGRSHDAHKPGRR